MTTENQPQLTPPPADTQPSSATVKPQTPPPPPPPPAKPKVRSARLWPLWLLSLLIILGVAALAWSGWQQLQLREVQVEQLQQESRQQQQRVAELERRYQDQLRDLERKAEQASQEVNRLDRQLTHTSQQVMTMGAKGRTDWLLAEAEYLLRLANQRSLMERDPDGALAILQAADQVLTETDDIALYPVRRQLAREIVALQAVAELDRTGVFLRLEALNNAVDQLQQRLEQEEQSAVTPDRQTADGEPPAQWQSALDRLWGEMKQLVVVRRLNEPAQPLMAPEHSFFLRQNLRLTLQQAELALLEKNQAMYDASLEKARQWVQRYYASESGGNDQVTRTFLNNITALQKVEVDPKLPDISESLRLLKSLVATLYDNRQRPQSQAPSSSRQPDSGQGSSARPPTSPSREPQAPAAGQSPAASDAPQAEPAPAQEPASEPTPAESAPAETGTSS